MINRGAVGPRVVLGRTVGTPTIVNASDAADSVKIVRAIRNRGRAFAFSRTQRSGNRREVLTQGPTGRR
jgi:hypothetical protein